MHTFTYLHLTAGVVQHKLKQLHSKEIDGNFITVDFTDDKGRRLTITTNQQFHLRQETASTGLPVRDADELEGQSAPESTSHRAPQPACGIEVPLSHHEAAA
jgi:hypothetical protein